MDCQFVLNSNSYQNSQSIQYVVYYFASNTLSFSLIIYSYNSLNTLLNKVLVTIPVFFICINWIDKWNKLLISKGNFLYWSHQQISWWSYVGL